MSGATEAGAIPDKWGGPAMTTTVEAFHTAIRKLVAERFAGQREDLGGGRQRPGASSSRARTSRRSRPTCSPRATGSRCRLWSRCRRRPRSTSRSRARSNRATSDTDEQGRADRRHRRQRVQREGRRQRHRPLRLDVETVMEMLTEGVPGGHDRDHRRLGRHAHRADPRRLHRRGVHGRHDPLPPRHPHPRVRRALPDGRRRSTACRTATRSSSSTPSPPPTPTPTPTTAAAQRARIIKIS